MRKYTIVRKGDIAENLIGRTPVVTASNPQLDAHLLERKDGRLFLYIGHHTGRAEAQMWANIQLKEEV